MLLIDRYILKRFAANFLVLLAVLFLFAVGIDVIINLDEFVEVARDRAADAGALRRFLVLLGLCVNFQAPRLFLFYSYMHGLLAAAAMAFTLAHMYRNRELVAILASGVSLHRLALPLLVGVFAVSLVQLLNQEFVLYRVAPLILRKHGDIGKRSVREFPVRFTEDGRRHLLQAASFDPSSATLTWPTILQRDQQGRAFRRLEAATAAWDQERQGWVLRGGRALTLSTGGRGEGAGGSTGHEPVDFFATDLDPDSLTVRRYGEYAAMLRLGQIEEMLRSGRVSDQRSLLRHRYARFATLGVNVLVLLIALPSFLLREPASLMRQSVLCSAMTMPALLGSALGMMVEMPGIPPAVSVFLPVIVLIPIAAARWTYLRT